MVRASRPLFILGSFVAAVTVKVDRLPAAGESVRARAADLSAGGKGLNHMVGARRLGAEVEGLLAVGDDLFATLAEDALRRAGLERITLLRRAGPSGTGVGLIDATGENCIAVAPGANLQLQAADVAAHAAAIVRAGMVLAQFEIDEAPVAEAFRLARAAGVPTLLNPSPCRLPASGLLAQTSILVLNAGEAAWFAQRHALAASDLHGLATALLGLGPEIVVITRGGDGAVAHTRGGQRLSQAAFAADVVDTTGAGDAFAAALAVSLNEGESLAASLRLACAAGALTTQQIGVFEALPDRVRARALAASG